MPLGIDESDLVARLLLERSLAGIYVIRDGRFLYVNNEMARVFGYSEAEILELTSLEALVAPGHRERVASNIARRLGGDAADIRYSFDGLKRDGSIIHVEVHGARIDLPSGSAVAGVLIDRTEGVEAERHALHLQKLEATARLAAGMAHDFKNVLATVRATAELVRLDTPPESALAADLETIIAAVDRGTDLSKQLMKLNLERPKTVSEISIADHVRKMRPTLERLMGTGMGLEVEIGTDIPIIIRVDPADIEQVLMNLVLNAVDAMGAKKGRVVVGVQAKRGADGRSCVCLGVKDTGPGIPDDVLGHVFEPYFTTKADKGTGLGLPNVQAIARRYGGDVWVESAVGRGTTVSVLIPCRTAQA